MSASLQDPFVPVALAGALVLLALAAVVLLVARANKRQAEAERTLLRVYEAAQLLANNQGELAGRLKAVAEGQASAQMGLSERFQAQERAVGKALEERLGTMGRQVGASMQALAERLAVIDQAQARMTELGRQVVDLQQVLGNKQARGAFGEVQLENLVSAILPPEAYSFQHTLSNGRRADCLIVMPNPPGPIPVDAKFPLESWRALTEAPDDAVRAQAGKAFSADVRKHVRDIAERYILPGETAESALMFLPSEAIYAELHANFSAVVEEAFRLRVWIVSPTTLMATLNTVRAVLRDARMMEQADLLKKEMHALLKDVERLDDRTGALVRHFEQTAEDLRKVRISSEGIVRHASRIREMELGKGSEEA